MHRLWLLFAQAVTVGLGILFAASVLRPDWVRLGTAPPANTTAQPSVVAQAVRAMPPVMSYAAAVARAAPSVVNVYTTKTVKMPEHVLPNDAMMRKYFGLAPKSPGPRSTTSLGSGVIAHEGGYILTNYHVVAAADAIEVALADGRSFNAELVGADPETDLAVLKLPADATGLSVAPFAHGVPLAVGDVVLAIGNPFGVGQTTTQGIVSALGRNRLGINTYENFIQTDAAINPGNSGGALVDLNGDLIGINTAIYSPPGGAMGIGFAIPIDAAVQVMEAIIRDGQVARGWLGIEPQDITAELANRFKLKTTNGIIVAGVLRDGPAGTAGLRVGDIVRSVENAPVADTTAMLAMIAALPPGFNATLSVLRAGKPMNVKVSVGVRPQPPRE